MKKKLLSIVALLCAVTAWGQEDVTATYLQNPDFEGEYTVQSNPSSDRAIYAPKGWTVELTNLDKNDMSVLKSTDLASNSFGGFTLNAEGRGEQTYWFRYRWGADQTLKVSQILSNLPAGVYRLTADVLNYSTDYNYTVMIYAGEHAQTRATVSTEKADNWNTLSCNFYVENDGDVEIGFSATNPKGVERILAVDNFKLYKLDVKKPDVENPVSMTGFIVNPCFDVNINDWTSTTGAQNLARATNKSGDITGGFYENWNGSAYSGTMSQTITDLPNGKYTVKIAAFREGGTGEVYVFANEGQTLVEMDNGVYYEATGTVLDGTLTFGLKSVDGGCNWMGLDNVSLTYMGVDLSALVEKLTAAREEATTLKNSGSVMSSLCRAALDDALTATENVAEEETALTEALLKVSAAVDAANKSIANNAIFAGGSVASNSIENWTYTGDNIWHVNTWSSEGNTDGSNMTTPFLEVWRSAGTNLSNGSVFYTLEGMEPGTEYTVTALVRVLNEIGTATTGLSMFANEAKQVIEGGEACNKGFYTTCSVTGVVGEDGVLKFGFDIADATFNWIAFKDIKLAPKAAPVVYDLVPTSLTPAEGEVENLYEYVVLTCEGEDEICLNRDATEAIRVYNETTGTESEFAGLDDSGLKLNQLMAVFDPTIATPGSTIVIEIPAGWFGDKDWNDGKGGRMNPALKYTYTIAAVSTEFALNSATWKESAGSEGIDMVGASLAQLTKGAIIKVSTNKSFGYATWTISNETDGVLKQGYVADRTPETSCEITMRGAANKLLQGQTYTFTLKAYETEAASRGGADPNVGIITFDFTGTQSAYVYSDVKFTNEIGEGVVLSSKEENTYVLSFDAPVTVKKAIVNLGQGMSEECDLVSNETETEWTVTLSSSALGQYDIFDLNVFAEDKEGHAVNKTADAPVMGSEDNTWFTVSFICDFNKPDFVVTPASETTVESIETITFSYSGGIEVSGSSTAGEITITDVTTRGQEKVVATFSTNDLQYPEGYDPEIVKDNKCVELHIDLAEPITSEGNYKVEVPAGFFVLGEQFESSSSKLTIIYYEVKKAVVDEGLKVEVNPAGGNVTEIPATIVLSTNTDYAGQNYDIKPTLVDGQGNTYKLDMVFGTEDNEMNIILMGGAITAEGTYTLTLPAGLITDGDSQSNAEDIVVVYTIETVAEPAVLIVSPESETTLESLETVTFSCEGGIAINPEATGKITIFDVVNRQEVASFAGEDLVVAENALSIVLSEAITAEGAYNVKVPEGFFLLGEKKVANEATIAYYSVESAVDPGSFVVTVNPAGGNVTEIPATIVLSTNTDFADQNYDIKPTLVDGQGNTYKLDMVFGIGYNEMNIILMGGAITAEGTYTLTLPAGLITDGQNQSNAEDIVVVYIIGTGDGIDAIVAQAGGKVDVYTVNGTCVLRNADAAAVKALRKGLYIINGKKVMLK